ncbi:beta-galactosidase [Gorillibacterium sp. CAU 1737]|uniref:beta-galactosidase n=1 Tax=Gorillibacterium sp. CAU 1737 TaxID=3140362 RepID=UPI0032600305
MIHDKFPKIWYGGDYNPEQWDEATMEEDLRMFKLAGIDVATVNVFSWARIQPDEETYHFEWLDKILNRLDEEGIKVCLATSTGAHPAWMARKYPDIRRVDHNLLKRQFGGRHNSCPHSPTYRKFAELLADKLAERYKDHPALAAWHIANEYGGYCYCENCAAAFRVWLQKRYGSIEALNKAWYTSFWGHTFYEWEDIVPPSGMSEEWGGGRSNFQSISLDYRRFQSESLLDCYRLEYDAIKKHSDVAITTNLMGTYPELDYFAWAKHMDVVSWDSYPSLDTPVSMTAMTHDLMRGLKGGQPFMLMEQTPSQQNWQAYNSLKRPGVMRLWSYQAVAHGADTVMFFQLRRSIGACEKYHGAVIEHVGHEHTRVFRECAELGQELVKLEDKLLDSRLTSKAAILYDWDNRWAIDLSSGPTIALNYVDQVHHYYKALYDNHIQTDLIGLEDDFDRYELIIAPVLYMIKPGVAEKIDAFVKRGGTFITTFFSGIVNETDLVTVGGYPGKLRPILGVWAEEIDALFPDASNSIVMKQTYGGLTGEYSCNLLCDLIHAEGAEVLAEYGSDFYKGMPVLTRNRHGEGEAWYIASNPEEKFLKKLIAQICQDKGIKPLLNAPEGVEVTERSKDGKRFTFLLNHNAEAAHVELPAALHGAKDLLSGLGMNDVAVVPGRGVLILEQV